MRVVDFSAGKPGAAAIKAAGYGGAVRYCGFDDPTNVNTRKCATKAELADFNAHELGMALVFEEAGGNWRGGYAQGVRDAQRARAHADRIGFPANRPIYMAIDQDVVTEGEFEAVDAYLDGAASVLGGPSMTGPYGEYDVTVRARRRGFRWSWQCRAWSGVPTAKRDTEAQLYQHFGNPDGGPNPTINNIQCDINDVLADDWGQHNMEDTMSWNEPIENHYGDSVPASVMLAYIDEHVNNVAAEQAAQRAILAAIAKDPTVTAAKLEEVVKNAVASANAAHLAAQQRQLDATLTVVREMVGARDEDLAAEVVDEIGRRTARPEAA